MRPRNDDLGTKRTILDPRVYTYLPTQGAAWHLLSFQAGLFFPNCSVSPHPVLLSKPGPGRTVREDPHSPGAGEGKAKWGGTTRCRGKGVSSTINAVRFCHSPCPSLNLISPSCGANGTDSGFLPATRASGSRSQAPPPSALSPARSAGAARSASESCRARGWEWARSGARPAASPAASRARSGAARGKLLRLPGRGRRLPGRPWPPPRLQPSPPAQPPGPSAPLRSPASSARPGTPTAGTRDGQGEKGEESGRAGSQAGGAAAGTARQRRRGNPRAHL